MILFILGRQPEIGMAELESLFGSRAIIPHSANVALADISPAEALVQPIGSTMKIAKVVKTFDSDKWRSVAPKIAHYLEQSLPRDGKMTLGLSAYGFDISTREIQKTGIIVKQRLKKTGSSLRLLPQSEPALNTAQVLHNKLVSGDAKKEIIIARGSGQTILAETIHVQDIDAYTFRDRSRPKRDPKVGMLPPKLAQTMINLAGGMRKADSPRLLDPFCGTGVVLQEAALMGYEVYGTDLEARMIEYSQRNLDWLETTHKINFTSTLAQGDATHMQWQPPINLVVCETYLGQPFSTAPSAEKLSEVMRTCDVIVRKFLKNLASQLDSGTPLCLGVPAWYVKNHVHHLSCLDSLEEIGYNRRDFTHAFSGDLIYHREGQVVGRELLVLTRS